MTNMTRISAYLMCVAAALMMACQGNGNKAAGDANGNADSLAADSASICGPRIEFDTAIFNFGRILQGEQVSTVFKFTNTGDANLIINRVETSCGCTVPEYDRQPVAPGGKGVIRVRFDSDGKEGTQYKTIKVTTNCKDNIFDLVLTGEVEVR